MCSWFKKAKLKRLLKKLKKLHQQRDQGANIDIKNEIAVLHQVANFYDKYRFYKAFPNADILALEYFRAAALLGDAQAQYICGERLLQLGRLWQSWLQGDYSDEIHQTYASNTFQEAFKYLKQAEDSGYALAKRLHGMAYIKGWGVVQNTDTGFRYVLESIEMENAWDRATKIFDELKINSPEFFNALMAYKAKRQ